MGIATLRYINIGNRLSRALIMKDMQEKEQCDFLQALGQLNFEGFVKRYFDHTN